MNIYKHKGRRLFLAGAMALAAAGAMAQEPGGAAGENVGLIRRLFGDIPGGGILLVAAVVLLVGAGVVYMVFNRRQSGGPFEDLYTEPSAMESSKFEQLLAETQGMYLRIQGGESKGYYRKIERLARIFLERIGIAGARQMSYDEIQAVLNGGTLSQKHATALATIFDRCRQGAEREGEKIDFTASELIKELRLLVKQAAEEASPKTPL